MMKPRLFTNFKEVEQIKNYLQIHNWYAEAYIHIKDIVDTFIQKGFTVPKESGYVFFETCPRDNTELIFNPYCPDDYYCPSCGMNYRDKPYKRSWILRYHSWLSQMSILVGIVYLLDGSEVYADTLRRMLLDYTKYYPDYPNNDNELGPTRLFQSTYMESVWIMYLAGAYDMVRNNSCFTHNERKAIENDLFKASIDIILDYDEKMNNRQAFNNAAICAVGFLLEDKNLIDYALYGPHGFVTHMNKSVLEDGLWYEGDNYHFATLPSIVNIAEVCMHNGIDLYSKEFEGHTIKMMYDAPLLSLQPDLTFPSRKDSRYANHIAQRWYAGLYELGYSRYLDPAYAKILKTMYSYQSPDNFNPPSAAGIMDIFTAQVSRRNRLDWRGFLNVTPDLGNYEGLPVTHSVNMKGTGLAVLRRNDKKIYASLDYGKYGGGHGHPDRLNLNLFVNGRRWLSDWGTGNYYFDHLKWYRSTIGHNTIVVDGSTQLPVDGKCTIFEETSMVSIASGQVSEIAPGVDMTRTIILLHNGLLFDFASVDSDVKHKYHYALHSFGNLLFEEKNLNPAQLHGENYSFIKDVYSYNTDNDCHSEFKNANASLIIHSIGHNKTTLFKGKAYGPPDRIPELFPVLIIERNEKSTDFINLMEAVEDGNEQLVLNFSKSDDGVYRIECRDGIKYLISKEDTGWTVAIYDGNRLLNLHSFSTKSTPKIEKPIENPIEIDAWIPKDTTGDLFKLQLRNMTNLNLHVEYSILNETNSIWLKDSESIVLVTRLDTGKINNGLLSIPYTVKTGSYEISDLFTKPLVVAKAIGNNKPVDTFEWEPNILLNSKSQVRRGEKHWQGMNDLSAEAMICKNETDLILKVKVKDDNVLFSGGKFYFDNDSIQVYFDRREEKYRNVTSITPGIYGFIVVPGVFDNSSSLITVGTEINDLDSIGVSTCITDEGYEVLMSIPWSSIGGRPKEGDIWGFDIIVNDRDSGVRRDLQMIWSGCYENERTYLMEQNHNPKRFGLLLL